MIRLSTDSVRRLTARLSMAVCVFALFSGVLGVAGRPSLADKINLVTVAADKQKKDPTLVLTQGMADIVEVDGPVSDIMVADPSIVDVMVLQANRLYMVGSNIGSTNIIAVDADGNVVKRMNVRVKIDDSAIQDMITDMFPDEKVQLSAIGNQVVLSGNVSNPDVANKIQGVVSNFVSPVVNMLSVSGEQQVMLRVKIVEASRDVLRELGVSTNFTEPEPGGALSHIGGTLTSLAGAGLLKAPLGTASVVYDNLGDTLGPLSFAIRALEEDGLINTLAEPNMTAVSGEQAGFLAGGEFPVPTGLDQNGNPVVDYRPFGVSLNFRPVVMSPERISLQLNTEVSAVSNQNSFGGLPSFTVRRAQTTVEMASGGSLMIAGLLRSDATKSMTDLPGIKNIPIISDLISSESFQRDESELVVIVTAFLVKPYADEELAEEGPSPERMPLAAAFEANIRRTYNRRPLDDSLFDDSGSFGYLID